MAGTVTISGTDPTNPRCLADVLDELAAMRREVEALAYRARQLTMFTGTVRDVLLDQRVPMRRAQEAADLVQSRMRALSAALDDAAEAGRRAIGAAEGSGAHPHQSFEWRPGVAGKRGSWPR
jgi:hypothetical protein